MTRSTKSLEEPPICRPALVPPTLYIAGADHLPVLELRQSIGPRPPLPPIPSANFLTSGRTMMHSAFAITSDGIFWSFSICCSVLAAFLSVSSSFDLLPAQAGRANTTTNVETSQTPIGSFLTYPDILVNIDM